MEDKKFVESPLKQKTKNFDSEFLRGWFPLCYMIGKKAADLIQEDQFHQNQK